ncbi:hypothetical protein N7475_003534 [Penicillium sp. IBT 31633x]|nr:hypothetical protein N7475_003534 [Penicillium sp. IBT 31633x]
MAIPPRSMTVIDGEFQYLKGIRKIRFEDVMAFLHDAQATLKYQGIYNHRGPSKRSLIHYAAIGDCAELLLYLLQDGTAKDDLDQNKRTPLSWAAQYSTLRAVKILLNNGAEINSMDNMYTTPFSWLIQAGKGPNRAATIDYLRSNVVKDKTLWGWLIRIERYFTLKIVMHRLGDTAPTYLLKMPAIPWTCVLMSKKAISVLRKQ